MLEGVQTDDLEPTNRRNVELLREYAQRPRTDHTHAVELRFLTSPLEILGDDEGRVRAVRVCRNELVDGRAVATDDVEEIECGLVLRAVGYTGIPIAGVPFDPDTGLMPNTGGRVTGPDGEHLPGEYVVGWIKRGPSGVIGTNKKDAAETTKALLEDLEAGRVGTDGDADAAHAWLTECAPEHVDWAGWEAIDAHETAAGEPHGRPRVKLVTHDDLREIGRRS